MRFCCPHFTGTIAPSDSLPAARHFTFWAYRSAPYEKKKYRAREGLPSSRHNFLGMPFPIHRRVLPRCASKGFTRPMAFAQLSEARLSLVPLGSFFDDAAGFTSCYGLSICSHSAELLCHGASTLGSLHQLPVSYEATWLLPRPDFHRLVVPSLASARKPEKNPPSLLSKEERLCFV